MTSGFGVKVWMPWVQVCREGFCEVSGAEFRDSWKSQPSETCAAMSPLQLCESRFSREDGHVGKKEFEYKTPMYVIYRTTKP